MANEVAISEIKLEYEDSDGTTCDLKMAAFEHSVTAKRVYKATQKVGTTQEAIGIGELASLGWAFFINRDATNYIELKVATSGAIFAKIPPLKSCGPIFMGSGAQAPFAIANTAECKMDYMLVEV